MTVLVGYLPTPVGEAALDFAIEEAKRRAEPILVLNSSHGGNRIDDDLADAEALDRVRSRLEESGLAHEILQETGAGRDGAEEVVHVAHERQASVIVIGLRRRSATGKFLFGSNAQRILLHSDVPVIAVKPAAG